MKIDLKLITTPGNYYDISFDETGDYLMTEGLDTAIIMSLFCEKRAAASDVPRPELQRGWWGNLFNDVQNYQQGSLLWLLYQAKKIPDTLNRARTYGQDGMSWFIDDGFADKIEFTSEYSLDGIRLTGHLFRSQNIVQSFSYELWQKTGLDNVN